MALLARSALRVTRRFFATDAETRMADKLKAQLAAERVIVEDQSGAQDLCLLCVPPHHPLCVSTLHPATGAYSNQ